MVTFGQKTISTYTMVAVRDGFFLLSSYPRFIECLMTHTLFVKTPELEERWHSRRLRLTYDRPNCSPFIFTKKLSYLCIGFFTILQ